VATVALMIAAQAWQCKSLFVGSGVRDWFPGAGSDYLCTSMLRSIRLHHYERLAAWL